MQLQAGLTKENCFDELMAKYPKAMKVFWDWIDAYKEAVDWNRLFSDESHRLNWAPEFYELPYDMQTGIILRFLIEQGQTMFEFFNGTIDIDVCLDTWALDKQVEIDVKTKEN